MQESPLNGPDEDPSLELLAAQLAGMRPRLTDATSQELLYHSAFAAGQATANRRTRRWRATSAALAGLLVATSISLASRERRIDQGISITADSVTPAQHDSPSALARQSGRGPIASLDAWRVKQDPIATFDAELEQFKRLSAASRELAVGVMTRRLDPIP